MNRNLALEFIRVTEMSAIASARFMGRGDERAADEAAVDAMRTMLDSVECDATVVIGEGNETEASALYIGEKVGSGNGPELEIALDPLEGSTVCATGGNNSISVMAIAEKGRLLKAPNIYMQKIAVGPEGKGLVDIDDTPEENLRRLAEAKKCRIQDLTVVVLDRPRHKDLIEAIRKAGARIQLIGDGDVAASIACCEPDSGVDILFGVGRAPEGVISAAALRCIGGDFQAKFKPADEKEVKQLNDMGITDVDKVFSIEELASGHVMFCATGVTTGNFLKGVQFKPWGAITHSVVMRSQSGTIRRISAEHHFDTKPRY
jgi:fructose-1,6-bisphosphatase class II